MTEWVESLKNKNIYIWGSGTYGLFACEILKEFHIEIKGFCDENYTKWGKKILENILCFPPNEISGDDLVIFIMIKDQRQCEEIKKKLGIMGYKDYYDTKYFFDKLNQNYEYLLQKFYKKLPYRIYQGEKRKKIGVIYTCVTGEYDNIDRVPFINSNFDFYYISDKKRTELSDMYYIDINDVVPKEANTSVLKARYCKTHPHTLFEEYQVSIYFDGKLKPFADFSQWVYDAQKTSTGIGGVKHPERNCIYMEGIACDVLKKAKKNDICGQMLQYMEEGMPGQYGLLDTCFMIRWHNRPVCKTIMEHWWKELTKFTIRDQLSLPYVLWKQGYSLADLFLISFSDLMNVFSLKKHVKGGRNT